MFRFPILYFFLILLLLSIKCFTVVGERQKEGPGAGVIRTGFTCKFSLHLILSVVRLGVVKHVEKDTFLGQSMESIFFFFMGGGSHRGIIYQTEMVLSLMKTYSPNLIGYRF